LVTAAKRAEEMVLIQRLYVLPEAQRQGIGTALLEAATAALAPVSRLRLQVEEANEQALAFYRKQGFEAAGHSEVNVEGVTLQVVEMEKQVGGT
jgi:GNAT superfamily N-acetyltransferase